jgi:uncharacterized protein with HEPN domain
VPLPLVHHRGTTFDRIIFEWVRDIEKAQVAIRKALEISDLMTETEWERDNNNYAAICKWIQSGLDSIQQWNLESGESATIIATLRWKDLRVFRNNLSHAFQEMLPEEVKQVAEDTLPDLNLLLNLISLSKRPIKTGETQYISVPKIEYLRRELEPFTIAEGSQLGKIGTALINIGYDERYYPRHVHLNGYQEDGMMWTATPYNDQDVQPGDPFIIPVQPKKPMLWTP